MSGAQIVNRKQAFNVLFFVEFWERLVTTVCKLY